ncbi:Uncharacterised protein [Atlantibacter hermannii]|nr:Uncharacterised protein [Atlantibacter hermannii]
MKKNCFALLLLPGTVLAQWNLPDLPAFEEKPPAFSPPRAFWKKVRDHCV